MASKQRDSSSVSSSPRLLHLIPSHQAARFLVFLIALGARVSAHFNTNIKPLGALVDEFGPERVRPLQADLAREDDVGRLFAVDELGASRTEGVVAFGPVQVLVVNHGYFVGADVPLVRMSLEQWYVPLTSSVGFVIQGRGGDTGRTRSRKT